MEAVFLKILELSCYGSLLILAVLPVRLLLRNAPKQMTCLLWAIVAVALICPVRMESPVSVLPHAPVEAVYSAVRADPVEPNTDAAAPVTVAPMPQTAPAVTDTPAPPDTPSPAPTEVGMIIWLWGMAVMLLYAAYSVLRLRRRVAICLTMGENVFLCDNIDTPFILGMLHPRIYLPSSIDEPTARQVLLHERAHLARRDHWWKPLGFLLLTVHWFNPLVWVGYVLLCRDIELACDEKVVRDMAASDKKQYTEALLTCSMPRHLIAVCPLAFGEVGVKPRIKAVLSYKKPAFWMVVAAILLCVALCVGFLTDPAVVTLEELGNVTAAEISDINIYSNENHLNQDPDTLFDLLAQLELQPELFKSSLGEQYHTITMQRRENAAIYDLYFSSDCTKLQLNRTVQRPDGTNQLYDSHYKVLNPEILSGVFSEQNHALTAYFTQPNTALRKITVQKPNATDFEFVTAHDITRISDVLSSLEFSNEPIANNSVRNKQNRIILETTDHAETRLNFNTDWTQVWVSSEEYVSDTYAVLNPATLQNENFPRGVYWAEDAMHTAITEFLTANKLNISNFSILHQMVEADGIYGVIRFDLLDARGNLISENELCLAHMGADNGSFYVIDIIGGQWSPSDGFYANYAEFDEQAVLWSSGSALEYERMRIYYDHGESYILPLRNEPFICILHEGTPIKLVPIDSNDNEIDALTYGAETFSDKTADLQIEIHAEKPITITDYPVSPTAAELQGVIEEHLLWNKNRHFRNLRILGDAFYDPADSIYYLLVSLDYTQTDGTLMSENNLQLISVLDGGHSLRVDGITSGEWGQSAGFYPNIAEMNGQLVLWTTRNATHMKLSEDGTSLDANASEPNEIYKLRIYCDSGNTYIWALQEHGGVFLLPEGDRPVKVVPIDTQYNELPSFVFGAEYFDPNKVRTVSEESGWDVFLNMDAETGETSALQSYPLYIDMDDSFADHAALYAAMKENKKLPTIPWSSVKLAGQRTYEGPEYAVITFSEGRDTVAALVEYETNPDGTVTLLHYAEGTVPDKQGFLTGYYMNSTVFGDKHLYWSLFDTRYAVSKDGKETDHTRTAEPAFTAFRFTMRDLNTHDFPVEGNFFLADFTTVIPPAIVTPIEGKTLLAALGSEAPGGLGETIQLTE